MAVNPIFFGVPILNMGAGGTPQYRLLEDHYINGNLFLAGTVVTEGSEIPSNWIPTPNVDPLTAGAVQNFYNKGPQDLGLVRTQWSPIPVLAPVTFWVQLTTGGSGSGPVNPIFFGVPILVEKPPGPPVPPTLVPNMWILTGLGSDTTVYPPKFAIIPHPVGGIPQ